MRIFVAAVMFVLLVLPALAQQFGTKNAPLQNGDQKQTEDRAKADEKAYRNSLGNLPAKKFDPWKDMR